MGFSLLICITVCTLAMEAAMRMGDEGNETEVPEEIVDGKKQRPNLGGSSTFNLLDRMILTIAGAFAGIIGVAIGEISNTFYRSAKKYQSRSQPAPPRSSCTSQSYRHWLRPWPSSLVTLNSSTSKTLSSRGKLPLSWRRWSSWADKSARCSTASSAIICWRS